MRKRFIAAVITCMAALAPAGLSILAGCSSPTNGGGDAPVSFDALTANGGTAATTTELVLKFSADIDGLGAEDIVIAAGDTGAAKGALAGTGIGEYTLAVSGISAAGDIAVTVTKAGYAITPGSRTVSVYFISPQAVADAEAVTEALAAIGAVESITADNKAEAEAVVAAYDALGDEARALVSPADQEKLEAVRERLAILEGSTPAPVSFDALLANGGTTLTTTELTLRFSGDIDGLAAGNILIDAGDTGAIKGALAGTGGGEYTLAVSGISAGGDIAVTVARAG